MRLARKIPDCWCFVNRNTLNNLRIPNVKKTARIVIKCSLSSYNLQWKVMKKYTDIHKHMDRNQRNFKTYLSGSEFRRTIIHVFKILSTRDKLVGSFFFYEIQSLLLLLNTWIYRYTLIFLFCYEIPQVGGHQWGRNVQNSSMVSETSFWNFIQVPLSTNWSLLNIFFSIGST